MNTKEAIGYVLVQSAVITKGYLDDLSDEDLLITPVDGMNSIAWQLGHLISAENNMLEMVETGASPALPDDFHENHSRENAHKTEQTKYLTKAEYLELFEKQREATLSVLGSLTDDDLAKEAPEGIQNLAKTLGEVMILIGTHYLMHAGQFVAVRRSLNKAIAM